MQLPITHHRSLLFSLLLYSASVSHNCLISRSGTLILAPSAGPPSLDPFSFLRAQFLFSHPNPFFPFLSFFSLPLERPPKLNTQPIQAPTAKRSTAAPRGHACEPAPVFMDSLSLPFWLIHTGGAEPRRTRFSAARLPAIVPSPVRRSVVRAASVVSFLFQPLRHMVFPDSW